MSQSTFKRNAHIAYFKRCLTVLPQAAEEHDVNRVTIAFFSLAGLELLGALDHTTRTGWINWLWELQAADGGFRGSPLPGPGHLPSTYTALCSLALLRAPLDRLDRPGLMKFLRACQEEDGSFAPSPGMPGAFQNDTRMSYCAAVTRAVALKGEAEDGRIKDIDVGAARAFLGRCRTWEGGYASRPGVVEAQGGTTYCAAAGLSLLGGVEDDGETTRWIVQRQLGGFQGRPGKLEDVCYSFWCCGALATFDREALVNAPANTSFILDAQSPIGGFGKAPSDFPDPFHSYLALAALALTPAREELGLKAIDAVWNLPADARDYLLA
ncbi:hypothetical protein CcaverHIS002_0104780 [Cutaneotrichosporon cavernicola]|uniref:Prenyltransferase alpha-alpha toroid domain-containing protein n=1 Tax=Cutaneotrichosporon cavernicola TaxID=279322 RepID=A0AA48IHX4_9TREE|nr:uncharacterized protein CcaverHIS019_0104710 [Cutaneotrichosporon cavernicola]BEI79949.1 hypothetical protein CcaverHIS002_0104780 [Cutaneotrichosporon cavernicola]BEI87753.1 hypothetical protein CcaverHIS019_0104710 [Cutaneotrichosporon cavernicola]BEJ03302.1 hypothetical protein CcaverHIS641_0104770 [Cutaneotrichosporon cavernicola]